MHDLVRRLEARGYLVLRCVSGQVFDLVAFPNAYTDRIAPGWIARSSTTSGFTFEEARAIAHDRGGSLFHLRDEDVM